MTTMHPELPHGETSKTVKDKLTEIQKTEDEAAGVFLKLVTEVENKLREIAMKKGVRSAEHASLQQMIRQLEKMGVLPAKLGHIIEDFRFLRNGIFHGKVAMTAGTLKDAITVGEIVLTELERVSP